MLAALSLEPEHRRGHGAAYDAVNAGRVDIARLRWSLAALPLPAWPDGRIRLAADVSNWLRPGAVTSPERLFCHVYARGKGNADDPGLAVLVRRRAGTGPHLLDGGAGCGPAGPDDDETEVTAAQVRHVVTPSWSPPGTGAPAIPIC